MGVHHDNATLLKSPGLFPLGEHVPMQAISAQSLMPSSFAQIRSLYHKKDKIFMWLKITALNFKIWLHYISNRILIHKFAACPHPSDIIGDRGLWVIQFLCHLHQRWSRRPRSHLFYCCYRVRAFSKSFLSLWPDALDCRTPRRVRGFRGIFP